MRRRLIYSRLACRWLWYGTAWKAVRGFGWGSGVAWKATGLIHLMGTRVFNLPRECSAKPTLLHQSELCAASPVC
jgi:hypothetical protein